MNHAWISPLKTLPALGAGVLLLIMFAPSALASDWSVSFQFGPVFESVPYHACPPSKVVHRHREYYPRYQVIHYPRYRHWNPVVRRDVYRDRYRDYDGTRHTERVVEDRHRSYYAPGRNVAVTPPRTRVTREYGPGYIREEERTTWIGADGRPHGTKIEQTTTKDPWGNSHTETQVDLWKASDPPKVDSEAFVIKNPDQGKTIKERESTRLVVREKPATERLSR